eukprot:1150534-Pelagomonas_calceolata.AAC.2
MSRVWPWSWGCSFCISCRQSQRVFCGSQEDWWNAGKGDRVQCCARHRHSAAHTVDGEHDRGTVLHMLNGERKKGTELYGLNGPHASSVFEDVRANKE